MAELSNNADELSPVDSRYRIDAARIACVRGSLQSLEERGLALRYSSDPDCAVVYEAYSDIIDTLAQEITDLVPGSSFSDIHDHRYPLVVKSLHNGRRAIAETNEAEFHLTIDGFIAYVDRCGDRIRLTVESYRLLGMEEKAKALEGYIALWPKDLSGELVRDLYSHWDGCRAVAQIDAWCENFNERIESLDHVIYSGDCLFPGMRYALAHPELFFTAQPDRWIRESAKDT